jgi:hypothetical protein
MNSSSSLALAASSFAAAAAGLRNSLSLTGCTLPAAAGGTASFSVLPFPFTPASFFFSLVVLYFLTGPGFFGAVFGTSIPANGLFHFIFPAGAR